MIFSIFKNRNFQIFKNKKTNGLKEYESNLLLGKKKAKKLEIFKFSKIKKQTV